MNLKQVFRILVFLLLVASCHGPQREARRLMDGAERLVESDPDSTVRLIDSLLAMDIYLSEAQRMEMALLQGEVLLREVSVAWAGLESAMEKSSPSPELEAAAGYFAQKRDYSKAARAALYSGFVQDYYEEKSLAMASFKDAERYGILAGDTLLVAKAQCWMGKLLFDDYIEDDALKLFEKSETAFGNHFEERSWVQNMMAACYIVLEQNDSAEICLRQSLAFADRCHSEEARSHTLNNYTVLYRVQGEYDKAIDCLRQEKPGADSAFLFLHYVNLAKLFAASGGVDSASFYYQQVEDFLPLVKAREETKASACQALSRFWESQGDLSKALSYRKQGQVIRDAIMESVKAKTVFGIQRRYDHEVLRNTYNQKLIHRHRIIIVVSMVAVLCFAAWAVSRIRLAKKFKEEVKVKNDLFHFMKQNKALSEMSEEQNKTLEDYAKRLSQALEKDALVMLKMDVYNGNKEAAYLKALNEAVFGDQDHWEALMVVFDQLYPGMRESLASRYPDLTELEQKGLILTYFNVSREEEALLLNKSVYMVDKWRASMKKKMRE